MTPPGAIIGGVFRYAIAASRAAFVVASALREGHDQGQSRHQLTDFRQTPHGFPVRGEAENTVSAIGVNG